MHQCGVVTISPDGGRWVPIRPQGAIGMQGVKAACVPQWELPASHSPYGSQLLHWRPDKLDRVGARHMPDTKHCKHRARQGHAGLLGFIIVPLRQAIVCLAALHHRALSDWAIHVKWVICVMLPGAVRSSLQCTCLRLERPHARLTSLPTQGTCWSSL
jgi:hypothetical protein